MYAYCAYPVISKIAETSVVPIDFIGVICRSTWIRYQKCFIRSM